ncbi:MAG: hypothetical protein UU77_C0010G0028 [candidate division WWE3 bacterium GW2011_GWC1_41_7]|uniref:General secretion pathway protein G n=4 Tax=Katanobacteria TaxID=422282 RepID=A0A0G0XBK1_UNCKA|nr:MAG: hypothetical protein UU72_C0010G0025 [candidate division WWE3 bacterium GW2011_GWB1_41_6]KKS21004.1 MAG: hypothetical protein UU77_C0010G0028 [candidate division WWE3 bacterium GW2011_GWC1_41_7]KKS21757.1 MAG: hypothetical protein UU80_C0021G0028 [candidate division WWE3 bacterium GW2011_GWA1_41_8]
MYYHRRFGYLFMRSFKKNKFKQYGFTMMELLIVISLIGILSGVMLNVVSSTKQKQRAEDAVKRTNIEKIVAGVEAYRSGQGYYPATAAATSTYIKWPASPGTYTYRTNSPTNTEFWVYVPMASVPNKIIKYCSNPPAGVLPKIKDCSSTATTTCTGC